MPTDPRLRLPGRKAGAVPRGAGLPASLLAMLLALLPAGCDEFITYQMWDGVPKIEPAQAEIRPGQEATFEVQGGKPPYTFAIASGGGRIAANESWVKYDAPDTPGQAVLRVTDDLGSRAEARVEIVAALLTLSPDRITLRVGESCTFHAEGGYPPYTFSVVNGGGSIGASSGVYAAPWYFTDAVVRVTDDRDQTRDAAVSVRLPWLQFPLVQLDR